jgi:hypothetical protein
LNDNFKIKFDPLPDTLCVLFDMSSIYDVNTFQSLTQYMSGIDSDLLYLRNKIIYIIILMEYLIITCSEKIQFPDYLLLFRLGYTAQDSSTYNFVYECVGWLAVQSVEYEYES